MFSRRSTRNFTKGVRVDLDGNMVTVDITIVVEYGSPVPDVARGIQENVKKAIETMSGLTVHSVDVHVSGVSFEREQRAAKELDEQQRKMLEQTDAAVAQSEAETEPAAEPAANEEDPSDDGLIEEDELVDEMIDDDFADGEMDGEETEEARKPE